MPLDFELAQNHLKLVEFSNDVVLELGEFLESKKKSASVDELCKCIYEQIDAILNYSQRKRSKPNSVGFMSGPSAIRVFRHATMSSVKDIKDAKKYCKGIKLNAQKIRKAKTLTPEVSSAIKQLQALFNKLGDLALFEVREITERAVAPGSGPWMQTT